MPTKEQCNLIFERIGYEPSVQQVAIHDSSARIRLVAGGERSGKSKSASADYTSRFWETPLLWLVAADYERTKAEFQYIQEHFDKLGILYEATKQVDPGELVVYSEGALVARVNTKSAKDPRKIAMEAPDGIVVCEASQIDYETYLRLRGRIAEKRGWMLLSGTFESSLGWYPELYNRWQVPNDEDGAAFSLPTWSNLAIYPGGRDDPEILSLERSCSKEWFLERYGGVPCPPSGRVFDEFSSMYHTGIGADYEFDPKGLVYLWVDPGYATAHVVEAIQVRGDHVWVIDEIYERNLVTSDIIKVAKQRPWWNRVVGGAIDVAGTQHQAMPAPAEVWNREAGVHLQSQRINIRDGVERMKTFLLINPITNKPLLHINAKCKGLISELGGCINPLTGQTAVYSWQIGKDGNVVGDVPADRNNHACFDSETEILTENGWVHFLDLPKEQKVATRNPQGFIEYQLPTDWLNLPYQGEMLVGRGGNFDFCVTPNHNLFVANQYSVSAYKQYKKSKRKEPQFNLVSADSLPYSSWLGRTGKWVGQDTDVVVTSRQHGAVLIKAIDFARYYGLWLAEGSKGKPNHKNRYVVHIDQKNRKAEVSEIVSALGLHVITHTNKNDVTRYTISCKGFYKYFASQGVSWEKRIPRELLNSTPAVLQALIEGYLVGDGAKDKKGYEYGASCNKALLGDFQEAAFKVGLASNVHDYSKYRTYPNNHGMFHISFFKRGGQDKQQITSLKKTQVSSEKYEGNVYCVTVPNGIIAVRRNGKVMWAGNCKALTYGLVNMFGYSSTQRRAKVKFF